MRFIVIAFCVLLLAGCGWVNRLTPGDNSPRVVVVENEPENAPENALAFAPAEP